MLCAFCLTTAVHAQSQNVTVTECDTVIDCDNLKYPTVRLGNVCWMSKNLATESYVVLGNVYAYESMQHPDVAENVAAYGRLYDAAAVMQDGSMDADGRMQGICPDGWYLPTVAYFEQLRANYTADDLRSVTGWVNVVGNNSTGFSWNASGIYNGMTSRFEDLLSGGYLWAVEMVSGTPVLTIFEMPCHCNDFIRLDNTVNICASVRCVKEVDNPAPEPEPQPEPQPGPEPQPETFTCGTSKIKDADGNNYETVQIGELCWTKTNLRTTKYRNGSAISNQIGTTVPAYYRLSETDKNSDIVKQTTAPDSIFGFYYNGYATVGNNLCPTGWHVPDTNDWKDLISYLKAHPEYWCDNDNSNLAKAVASRNCWFNVETPPITYTINNDAVARPCSPQYQGSDYLNDASYFSAVPAGAWYDNLGGNIDTVTGLGGREFDPGKDAHFWSSSTQPGSDSTGYFFRLEWSRTMW